MTIIRSAEKPAVFGIRKYKVKFTGRAGLVYSEGSKRMLIDSELQSGPNVDVIIYSGSIKRWEPPHQDQSLSSEDVLRIRRNISKALAKLRVDWH